MDGFSKPTIQNGTTEFLVVNYQNIYQVDAKDFSKLASTHAFSTFAL
jgi:hypothetical protein